MCFCVCVVALFLSLIGEIFVIHVHVQITSKGLLTVQKAQYLFDDICYGAAFTQYLCPTVFLVC